MSDLPQWCSLCVVGSLPAEHLPAPLQRLRPHLGPQVAQVQRELVEHQRQRERHVLVLHARVPGPDRALS